MTPADFGKYLAQQRELRGMSREEVSRSTKIPPSLIAALETGQVERLPARIFVLNYIKSYSAVIGLAPEEAILRYEEAQDTLRTELPPAAQQRERRRRVLFWFLLWVLAIAAVAAALLGTGKLSVPASGH